MSSPPFNNLRVLDFTHVYAGPFATFQLGVMGAEVIKVEPPGRPDQMRGEGVDEAQNRDGLGTTYIANNQGKLAIAVDLAAAAGAEIVTRLLSDADVVVENYSGLLRRHGLGPDEALRINPRLVYCEMSGFGADNPRAGWPAYDPVIQAASGMMSLNGEADRPFLRVGPPLIDYGTGAQTAFAIAAALYQRELSGQGQVIEVNMFDAALLMMSPHVANAACAGKTDQRSGNVPPLRPGYSVYDCRDDQLMIGAFTVDHHRRLFAFLGIGERLELPAPLTREWISGNAADLRGEIQACLATDDAGTWEARLNEADIPAARVRDLYDVLANDQPRRAPASQLERFPGTGITAPAAAFRFAGNGPGLDTRCARHGEDTRAVLSGLGYSDEAVEALQRQGVISCGNSPRHA